MNPKLSFRKVPVLLAMTTALTTASYSQTTSVGAHCDLSIYGEKSVAAFMTFDREFRQAIAERDASKIALLVEYPLRVNEGWGSYYIRDAASLDGHFSQIFTPLIREAVKNQRLSEINCFNAGVEYGNGDLWVDRSESGYAIRAVNTSSAEKAKALAGSVEIACRTEKARVLVDVGQNRKPRYRSWERPHAVTEAPGLTVSDGAKTVEGTGYCTHNVWTFARGTDEFSVSELGCFPDSNQPPREAVGQLSITSGGKHEWWWCF